MHGAIYPPVNFEGSFSTALFDIPTLISEAEYIQTHLPEFAGHHGFW